MEIAGPDFNRFGYVMKFDYGNRNVSTVILTGAADLADLTSPDVGALGVTGELSAGSAYVLTQQWADAFHAAGYGGVAYQPRFSPGCLALGIFGAAGKRINGTVAGELLPALNVLAGLGIPVQDPPADADVDFRAP